VPQALDVSKETRRGRVPEDGKVTRSGGSVSKTPGGDLKEKVSSQKIAMSRLNREYRGRRDVREDAATTLQRMGALI